MRGKATNSQIQIPLPGITPACAGKRTLKTSGYKPEEDHPRVCGEKFLDISINWNRGGSPPRVRGKVKRRWIPKRTRRITPACAGKSNSNAFISDFTEDHPRVCGEKFPGLYRLGKEMGSPPRVRGKAGCCRELIDGRGITPRVRGKDHRQGGQRQHHRITPACAGKRWR